MSLPEGPHLRIGHVERDRAVEIVREAAATGRLTLAELDGRIAEALQARTREDLWHVLVDLVPPGAMGSLVSPDAAAHAGPGTSWDDPVVLTARWHDVYRAGAWLVPAFLELNPVAGNIKLDFTDARIETPVVDLAIVGGAGDVIVVVPPGMGADCSGATSGAGSVKSRVEPRSLAPHAQLVVRGRLSLGNVKVRHPNRWDTWRRERRLARGGGLELRG